MNKEQIISLPHANSFRKGVDTIIRSIKSLFYKYNIQKYFYVIIFPMFWALQTVIVIKSSCHKLFTPIPSLNVGDDCMYEAAKQTTSNTYFRTRKLLNFLDQIPNLRSNIKIQKLCIRFPE